ncbi:MAG: glucose 1-dehydrogenase [Deltaproteobacteria bacterium]|uniref:Glucose 1-dehydrogenase n=1 Tax=Candidatus Desulfacyla euxinica TaxID=2841693 RepID=A0A8J6T8J7_9DELT|nr:glucose 1-dehydrogenase [Candidatus Desulfacyla euxinica]
MDLKRLLTLKGKTALVTGSARGLGKEIALGFAQNGASLVLADVEYPEETAKQVKNTGADCIAFQTDVSHEEEIKDLADRALSEYGKIDILVNNAGVSQLNYTPSEDQSLEEWDRIIRINLRGTFICCKYFGKLMIDGDGGSIVNIASTAGITGVPRAPAYCASKAGVILLTKTLALEWAAHAIRVNAIAPHYLETDLTRGLRESEMVYKGLIKPIPMKRFGKASEIANTVLFLVSDASTYTTGTVVCVDGGYLAQ